MSKKTSYQDKTIYNIDNEDFTTTYDLDGNKQAYTIYAKEYGTFLAPIADHLSKHLADKVLRKRGVKTNYPDEYNKVLAEIEKHEHI